MELCEKLKWTGNLVFKAGDHERALRRYTTAKTMVDSDHDLSDEDKASAGALKITLLNNLATVCAKLGQLEEVKKHWCACSHSSAKPLLYFLVRVSFLRLVGDAAMPC